MQYLSCDSPIAQLLERENQIFVCFVWHVWDMTTHVGIPAASKYDVAGILTSMGSPHTLLKHLVFFLCHDFITPFIIVHF